MRRELKSEPAEQPKPVTLPTDLEQIMWNALLFLTLAIVGVALIKPF